MCLIAHNARVPRPSDKSDPQSGNVFFAIFGAVAMVGVLTAAVATFIKGPLATSVKLTKVNTAENQMAIGAQIAVMAAASQANGGDCEDPDGAGPLTGDAFVEPMEWRSPTTEPVPTNGGLVPLTLGISKKDPWGTEYGFCVWNHGPATSGGGCGANMLAGTNSTAYPVVALVSAGPDKAFTTTCLTFTAADVNTDGDLDDAGDSPLVGKAAETDDDIITTYTYEEATGASGGLWSLKSGDPNTATIGKNIETTGTASLQGGILLPDKSLLTCDATTAGVMAMNGNAIEICDGSGWEAITGGVAGGGLVLSPNVSTGMDVTAGCGNPTCYSSNVTFTLTNNLSPAATSVALATSLSNTANFEFVSDGCNGVSLAAGASCQMVVRAKASGNVSYAGTLNVTGNNSPLATLDGTGSGFAGCNAGGMGPGGYYVACGVSGYDLVVTPGGCTSGVTNPTCAGGTDTVTKYGFGGYLFDTGIVSNTGDGQLNSATLTAYSGGSISFPAIQHCDSLVYAGYDDWFLPSQNELVTYFYPNRTEVGGFVSSGGYISSNVAVAANNLTYYMAINGTGGLYYSASQALYNVRCMRWTPAKAATPAVDTTPNTLTFNASYGAASETRTSNAVTIYGVTSNVAISVSGSGSPQYSINGGAYTSSAGTASNGDQITLRATSPALGLENVVSLTVGSSNFNWQVRTPGNNTIRVFTTSTTTTGALGGAGGADSFCTNRATAVGLPGSWTAVVGTGAAGDFSLSSRLPWNWKTLKNMNGTGSTVAVSLADFLDGSVSAPMNYSESGGVLSSTIWTGMNSSGATSGNCASWGASSGSGNNFGDSSATSGGNYFYAGGGNCGSSLRLLCMETNAAGADTDPNAVSIRPQVTFASGGTGTSNTVTVTGVTDEVPVTITPSAGTANIIKDGISVGATTTTAGLNATLAFTLTTPAVLGTKNTATITIGPDTYTWWVGYADSAREAKVFVTSTTTRANLGGLSGADSYCATRAATSSYGLSSQWKAILSDSNINAIDRVPWNWGSAKTLTDIVVADGGITDMFDGTFDAPININENGTTTSNSVWTGTDSYGMKYYPGQTTAPYWNNDWTQGYCCGSAGSYGNAGVSSTNHLYWGTTAPDSTLLSLYCIEDIDNTSDSIPNDLDIPYNVQVTASSRQSSAAVIIGGMSTGATTTLAVSATGGNPTFTVNGGAEVTSAAVDNGDSIVFKLDAPAADNSSNKMTITAGAATLGYWRVWTGDSTGTVIKRIFTTSVSYDGNFGGVSAADTQCNTRATAAGLGGTWKAIISGTTEADWAVNRIGYNWSELQRTDGTTVVYAPNLWKTATTSLLAAPHMSETSGTFVTTGNGTYTNTRSNGNAYSQADSLTYNCFGWTARSDSSGAWKGTLGVVNSSWISAGQGGYCGYNGYRAHFYCIEQ